MPLSFIAWRPISSLCYIWYQCLRILNREILLCKLSWRSRIPPEMMQLAVDFGIAFLVVVVFVLVDLFRSHVIEDVRRIRRLVDFVAG